MAGGKRGTPSPEGPTRSPTTSDGRPTPSAEAQQSEEAPPLAACMHACADESAGAREERPSKRSTPTESELADAPMLSDSDLMPPEMEEQLSEEASNLPTPSEPPSAAFRSFHF